LDFWFVSAKFQTFGGTHLVSKNIWRTFRVFNIVGHFKASLELTSSMGILQLTIVWQTDSSLAKIPGQDSWSECRPCCSALSAEREQAPASRRLRRKSSPSPRFPEDAKTAVQEAGATSSGKCDRCPYRSPWNTRRIPLPSVSYHQKNQQVSDIDELKIFPSCYSTEM